MSDHEMLSQEEIDALLKVSAGQESAEEQNREEQKKEEAEKPGEIFPTETSSPAIDLTPAEKDALGEVGNISMGSASTTLSELLRQKVTITSPKVTTCTQETLFASFKVPFIIIQVEFKSGLHGFNVLVMQQKDAAVIADLMMGGDGTNPVEQITEMELSAVSEAMNQMIGRASTSLSEIFGRPVNISPPVSTVLEIDDGAKDLHLPIEDPIVVISFKMIIGNLLDTEIMQIMGTSTAREEANLLLQQLTGSMPVEEASEHAKQETIQVAQEEATVPLITEGGEAVGKSAYAASEAVLPAEKEEQRDLAIRAPLSEDEQRKLELLLDIPLKVSVILGRTKRPIKEVLGLTPGAVVELSSQVNEPVEVLANGTLIARGEIVVINENFGVRITSIISPSERIKQLGS